MRIILIKFYISKEKISLRSKVVIYLHTIKVKNLDPQHHKSMKCMDNEVGYLIIGFVFRIIYFFHHYFGTINIFHHFLTNIILI
jgi:hypothetical protein